VSRPRLLDLFCGAGGAAVGYHRAGFDVVGVDLHPQPNYPFTFVQADALAYPLDGFDAVHASPPCQAYSTLSACRPGLAARHPDLVDATRVHVMASRLPYVIENVPGAPLWDPIVLCGTMFGLGYGGLELRRHRLFESNVPLVPPGPCRHGRGVIGVYGDHVRIRGSRTNHPDGATAGRVAMGMPGATVRGMAQAIPPAYTEHIGRQLLDHLGRP
jgi:DNA (cytosine-5)-methyltransferase 1